MHKLKLFLLLVTLLKLLSCRPENEKGITSVEQVYSCCDSLPPPPPPPIPFQLIKAEKLQFSYGDSMVSFQASLFTNRLFLFNGNVLQTFSIIARNDYEIDSFYFALPVELNRYWNDVTVLKEGTQFNIGYYNYEKKFISLYTLNLGDFKLNRNRIFLSKTDTAK